MTPRNRKLAGALTITGAAFAAILSSEGFTPKAVIPIPGDVPTIGYGSTAGVKMGDTITESVARSRARREVKDEYEAGIQKCAADVMMTENEFSALVDQAYNSGVNSVCRSSIIRKFREGRYEEGCAVILTFDMLQGRHCRQPHNLKYFPGCKGIMARRQRTYNLCMAVAS